jgi:uncharacterized protein YcfL
MRYTAMLAACSLLVLSGCAANPAVSYNTVQQIQLFTGSTAAAQWRAEIEARVYNSNRR